MKKIGVGVIGAGYITAKMHAPQLTGLKEFFEFLGICDLNKERAESISRQFGPKVYPDYDSLLGEKRIELIVIATKPDSTHADLSIQALSAGKHVLVDKPMANSSQDCSRMIAAARKDKKILSVNHSSRWCLDFLMVKEVIAKGTLGKIRLIKNFWLDDLESYGSMLHIGCHTLDQSLQLNPGKILEVSGVCGSKDGTLGTAAYFNASLRFEDGMVIETGIIPYIPAIGLCPAIMLPHFYLLGEKEVFALDWLNYNTNIFERVSGFSKTSNRYLDLPRFLNVQSNTPGIYESLYAAIREGKRPAVTAEEGRRVIRVLELIFESSQQGKTLRLKGV